MDNTRAFNIASTYVTVERSGDDHKAADVRKSLVDAVNNDMCFDDRHDEAYIAETSDELIAHAAWVLDNKEEAFDDEGTYPEGSAVLWDREGHRFFDVPEADHAGDAKYVATIDLNEGIAA